MAAFKKLNESSKIPESESGLHPRHAEQPTVEVCDFEYRKSYWYIEVAFFFKANLLCKYIITFK